MAATRQNKKLFEDYDGFVEKFKPKKTTDDCYTPPIVYNAVAEWVANEYSLDKSTFVRPFYPGGDYEREDYNGKIVVDNPPFSILAAIVDFYLFYGIKFFLFAPTLTSIMTISDRCTALPVGVDIAYTNGAVVVTSFVTNLEPFEIRMRTAPTLYAAVDKANRQNKEKQVKQLPKYVYPPELITSAQIYPYNKYGIDFKITRKECIRVGVIDAQKPLGKTIFGGGLLLNDRLTAEREKAEREKAEREKAEREKAEVFKLSERERYILSNLNTASKE